MVVVGVVVVAVAAAVMALAVVVSVVAAVTAPLLVLTGHCGGDPTQLPVAEFVSDQLTNIPDTREYSLGMALRIFVAVDCL